MVPGPSCALLPASGHAGPVPPGHFVHPDTGRVLPEAGNLGYDLLSATLLPTTDSNASGVRTSEAAILPYVPYPPCPASGSPPALRLPVLQPRRASGLGALMTDPVTGIEVPVLAVTLHPQTRQWLTLGGTYCNPLTQTVAPLELGAPVEDPATGDVWPILGVAVDEDTGEVLALGGLRDASGTLLLPGDCFVEPLSGKTARFQGVCRHEGRMQPHAGGSQALLDANVLVAQTHVTAVLRQCQERAGPGGTQELEAALEDMQQALSLSLAHALQQAQRLERQLEAAEGVQASGGRLGTMCYPGTEQWIPALYGMEIPDPEGSGLLVPILGMERDGNSDHATPLAGSMEDAYGQGVVPISIGAQAIDPLTGEPGPVIAARMDPSTGLVVPVVQVLEALPRGLGDPGLVDTLERELRARGRYWRHQGRDEEQVAELLGDLTQEVLFTPGRDAGQQLRAAEEACAALETSRLQESQRRARALSTQSSPELGLLSQADREEWEWEAQVLQGVQKCLQTLRQAAEKLRRAVARLRGQEEEMWLQRSMSQSPPAWNCPTEVVQHLSDEFREVVRERQSFLDRALSQLQFQRELSHLQLLHSQMIASGTPVCLENYPGGRFYGTVTTSHGGGAAACPVLIPFLKSLTAALVGAQGDGLGLEGQRPGADKADGTWTSPLLSALNRVDIWSQAPREDIEPQGDVHHQPDPKSSLQDLPKFQTMQKEELITVQLAELSAREFVVYQYGLSILHLLIPQLHTPEITLQIASRLPATQTSDNAFQGSFFYERAAHRLLVGRESLASVGSFALLLIQGLAHIATEDLDHDSHPAFLRSFYEGLKIYFKEAFSITLQMSAVSRDSKFGQIISAILLEEQPISEGERDLLSKLIERKHESPLEPESLEEYIKKSKDLLLFTNMEHFLKSILTAEQQKLRKPGDHFGGEDKL
ncbi:uncharacterized protein [Dasypus novemcinctus]|uniref:uncharacterized protein n=1 Tax=Dasypus novemcinctus TaxID=9361 RepID=UPI0039C9138F